ncbi:MAG: hypothetical protein K2X03_23010 [Bryobacteraceae bacterium]|nr:hypothetical protein [Bryobacteraceae bacterium]
MSSAAQQAANQANSHFSTGPRTEAGKAKVSQNANRHNLTGRLLLSDEEKQPFADFEQTHRDQIQPTGPLELTLFAQFIAAAWNLQRLETLESEALANADFPLLDRLTRYHGRHERSFHRALKELKALQTAREIQARLANPNKTELLPLADAVQVKRIGFVLSAGANGVAQMLKDYLFAPPPGQSATD